MNKHVSTFSLKYLGLVQVVVPQASIHRQRRVLLVEKLMNDEYPIYNCTSYLQLKVTLQIKSNTTSMNNRQKLEKSK